MDEVPCVENQACSLESLLISALRSYPGWTIGSRVDSCLAVRYEGATEMYECLQFGG
jgi:hypothetical protein